MTVGDALQYTGYWWHSANTYLKMTDAFGTLTIGGVQEKGWCRLPYGMQLLQVSRKHPCPGSAMGVPSHVVSSLSGHSFPSVKKLMSPVTPAILDIVGNLNTLAILD